MFPSTDSFTGGGAAVVWGELLEYHLHVLKCP